MTKPIGATTAEVEVCDFAENSKTEREREIDRERERERERERACMLASLRGTLQHMYSSLDAYYMNVNQS